MVILGGIGNIYGVVIGALIIGIFDRILTTELTGPMNNLGENITWGPVSWLGDFLATHNLTTDRLLIFGLALVILMLVRPGGLFPSERRAAEMAGDDDNPDNDENDSLYDTREQGVAFAGRQA